MAIEIEFIGGPLDGQTRAFVNPPPSSVRYKLQQPELLFAHEEFFHYELRLRFDGTFAYYAEGA